MKLKRSGLVNELLYRYEIEKKEGHVDAAPLYVIRICRFNEIMSYVNLEVYQDSLQ